MRWSIEVMLYQQKLFSPFESYMVRSKVSIPIALLIWIVIYPMMPKIDFIVINNDENTNKCRNIHQIDK